MKKKLTLNKSVISKLTEDEQIRIKGGEAAFTSSGNCTGFLCCHKTVTCPSEICEPSSPMATCISNTCGEQEIEP